MPYVLKSPDGRIKAVRPDPVESGEVDFEGWEFIEGNAKAYLDFLQAALSQQDRFRESDIHLARVLEDLISLLIDRSLINFTDFPQAAQKRLLERETMRKSNISLDIIDHGYDPFSDKLKI